GGARLSHDWCWEAVSPDRSLVARASGHAVRLWTVNPDGGRTPVADRYPVWPAERIEISRDGRRMLTSSFWDQTGHLWDLHDRRGGAVFTEEGAIGARLSRDGRWAAGTNNKSQVVVFDAATGAAVRPDPAGGLRG